MAAKLTLSVDPQVVLAAKLYAAAAGTSVSQLVEDYLAAIVAGSTFAGGAPVLARVRGSMRAIEVGDYRAHLVEKYG